MAVQQATTHRNPNAGTASAPRHHGRATLVIAAATLLAAATGASSFPVHAGGEAWNTSAGPDVPFEGCFYYEHEGFNGERTRIDAGTRRRYVGDGWNDRISSAACAAGCEMQSFEHRDYAGATRVFSGAAGYVGDDWNDRISSMKIVCGSGTIGHLRQFRSGAGKCLDVHAP